MITFTRALAVAPGDPVTSREHNALAAAVNDRLLSGVGDAVYRTVFYGFSAFRQIRNPDSSFNLWPPQAEFHERYQAHAPADGEWPVAGPGEPEGSNVSSLLPAFVFGNAGADLSPEDERTADQCPLWLTSFGEPTTAAEFWEVGKRQRGAFDPATGDVASPAFTAAQEHFRLRYSLRSPHGNSYGGFLPQPVYLGDCPDGTTDTQATPSFEIFFTNLHTGAVTTYPGTCPEVAGNVAFIAEGDWAYYVYLVGGQVDVYPFSDYIQGPYSGGDYLMKAGGDHMRRILAEFSAEFRGTEEQRERWMKYAFDTQRFMQSQYLLAPARGNAIGDGTVQAEYPAAVKSGPGTFAAGVQIPWENGEAAHATASGCVLAAWHAAASGLTAHVTVSLYSGAERIGNVTLTPDADGNAASTLVLRTAEAHTELTVSWGDTTKLGSSARVRVELAELYEYKPGLHDLYLVLRLGSCLTNLSAMTDGDPERETMSAEISAAYFAQACIVNVRGYSGPPGSGSDINTNAVFESARRWSKFLRIVPRQQLVGYAVENGKSVLWYRREPQAWPGAGDTDSFEGVGPSVVPVVNGSLRAGYSYTVSAGDIVYNGTGVRTGDVFTAVSGRASWEGGGTVMEHEGIRATAPPAGLTNRWVIGFQFKGYNPSESSIWKPDSYSDYWFLSDRCMFYHDQWAQEYQTHFDYGSKISFAPETPPGYRYVDNKNVVTCAGGDTACEEMRLNRYRSCRIYEPDLEVESAVADTFNGAPALKLTLVSRLHSCPSAPATIDRDVTAWTDDPSTEEFRSTENALREYLSHVRLGTNCTKEGDMVGNAAYGSDVTGLPDDPFGSCYPHTYLVQLIPEVPEDDNERQDKTDAAFYADSIRQVELYTRAMCEGFVDGTANRARACTDGLFVWDYTWENLCFEAFSGRTIGYMPMSATDYTDAEATRPENPQGYGPMSNTDANAEVFNRLVAAVNLLTRARVMLPWSIECKTDYYLSTKVVTPDWCPTPPCDCMSANAAVFATVTPNEASSLTTPGAWADCGGTYQASCAAALDGTCDGVAWNLNTERNTLSYRLTLPDDAIEIVPPALRELVEDMATYGRLLATTETVIESRGLTTDALGEDDGCWTVGIFSCFWGNGSSCYVFPKTTTTTSVCDFIPAAGTISAPFVGRNCFAFGRSGAQECIAGVTNSIGFTPILGRNIVVEIPSA